MDSNSTFITGTSPDHWPALIAALLLPVAVWFALGRLQKAAADGSGWAAGFVARLDATPFAGRVAACLLLLTGIIHLALPLGHHDEPALNLAFLAGGILFVKLAFDVVNGKRWRLGAAVMLLGSIGAYIVLTLSGSAEEPDQVGIATKLVELTALGLVVVPSLSRQRGMRKLVRPLASSAFVFLVVFTGAAIWGASFKAHDHAEAAASEAAAHNHGHGEFASRAQAGTIMSPGSDDPATIEDVEAGVLFANATKAGIAKYADPSAAIADGYKAEGPALGAKRHFGNAAYKKDGDILDPEKPEMLVYGVEGDKFVLLGAVYVMEKAGDPGPEFAGPIARWHAHNICATVLPPAFGLVSPFGGCPLASVNVTIPEMIHVWTAGNPGGPYASDVSDSWVRGLLASR